MLLEHVEWFISSINHCVASSWIFSRQELLYLLTMLLYGLVKYNCARSVIILVITFMQGIYKYIPETNHVSRVYSVAAVLHLHFLLHVILYLP